jgi:hypothetical protein
VRHLEQDAGAVARTGVGRDSAPVREISQELERLLHHVAGANAMDVSNETQSARIVLVSRVVQSLRARLIMQGHQFATVIRASHTAVSPPLA